VSLENVKAGDMLYTRADYGHGIFLFKADRVTATQVICGGSRFNRQTGKKVGSSGWGSKRAYPATEKEIRQAKEQYARAKIKKYCEGEALQKLSLESLEIILAALPISRIEKSIEPGEVSRSIPLNLEGEG